MESAIDTADGTEFAQAFSDALRRSGMTMRQVVSELDQRGVRVTTATLSYWRRGKRRPGRRSSIETLRAVEEILGMESGSLLALVIGPRARGRRRSASSLPEHPDPAVTERVRVLVGELGLGGDARPVPLILHETVRLDAAGRRRAEDVTQVLRAEGGDVAAFLIAQEDAKSVDGLGVLGGLSVGTVTARVQDEALGVVLHRVELPTPLREGDTLRVDHTMTFPEASGRCHRHDRWFPRTVREHVVTVEFEPGALVERAESYVLDGTATREAEEPMCTRPVAVHGQRAQSVRLDVPPGLSGMRWVFRGENEQATSTALYSAAEVATGFVRGTRRP